MTPRVRSSHVGTYLDTVNGRTVISPSTNHVFSGDDTVLALRLLAVLVERGPLPVAELQREVQLAFTDFSRVLDNVRLAGLVEISGPFGGEVVELTPTGESLALLQR